MNGMSTEDKLRLAKVRTTLALQELRHFLPLVTTLEESTHRKLRWPADLEYLAVAADELQYSPNRVIWIPKSRRMMATWLVTAYALWSVIRNPNFLALVQSQTEQHSKDLLEDRIKLMYANLPRWFKFLACPNEPAWTALDCRFRDKDSRIRVFPQGAKQFRQYTPSLVIVDEAAHQDEFQEALTAMIPFIEKDTRVILLSSLAPSFFADVVYGERANDPVLLYPGNSDLPPERRKGVQKWDLLHGGTVLQLHYSADPNKNNAWLQKMDKEVAGGIDGPQWRQEFELEADAFSGELVYDNFTPRRHVAAFEFPRGNPMWLTADYGLRHPTAVLQCGLIGHNTYGPIYGVRKELHVPELSIDQLKRAIMLRFGPSSNYQAEWIDPSTDSEREGSTSTHYHMFNNGPNARSFQKAYNGDDGIVLIREWLHQDRLLIHPECTHLIYELGKYRFQEWASDKQRKLNDPKERVVKKEDDACDALKYFANGVSFMELPEEEEAIERHAMEIILDELAALDTPMIDPSTLEFTF